MDADRYSDIFQFLRHKLYPPECNKSKKQALRRLSEKFALENEKLFYIGKGKKSIVVKDSESAKEIFRAFHYIPIGGHSGVNKTIKAIDSRYYWPSMTVDIEKWISDCSQCQQLHPPQSCKEMQHFKVSKVWELLAIDLIGPLPTTVHGNKYILTAIDFFSKWVEACPLKTKNTLEIVENLVNIFLSCGCPKRILSDQGCEFVDEINKELCEVLQANKTVSAVYHPQTNNLDERTNATVKSILQECVSEHQEDWDNFVASAVFSIVSKPNTTTKVSPFFLMYNREARFPSGVSTNLEHFVKTSSNNTRLYDMECEHAYSCVREASWDNGMNGNISNLVAPKRKRSCTENENSLFSNGTKASEEEPASKVTRSNFVSIKPNQGVFQSECWKPNGSTLYHPVTSQLLVNIEKYDQISFEEGLFFIGDATGGCLQKDSGHAIHCWRYDEKERKLFISLSFFFTNFHIFQEVASLLGAT